MVDPIAGTPAIPDPAGQSSAPISSEAPEGNYWGYAADETPGIQRLLAEANAPTYEPEALAAPPPAAAPAMSPDERLARMETILAQQAIQPPAAQGFNEERFVQALHRFGQERESQEQRRNDDAPPVPPDPDALLVDPQALNRHMHAVAEWQGRRLMAQVAPQLATAQVISRVAGPIIANQIEVARNAAHAAAVNGGMDSRRFGELLPIAEQLIDASGLPMDQKVNMHLHGPTLLQAVRMVEATQGVPVRPSPAPPSAPAPGATRRGNAPVSERTRSAATALGIDPARIEAARRKRG